MTQSETKPWKTWRIKRLLRILELKANGLTDQKTAEKLNISRSTVFRELNSPQSVEIGRALRRRAEGMVWPLVETQLREIEGGKSLKAGQKLIYRGKLIDTLTRLVPKQVEQKISGELQQKIEVEGIELIGLDESAVGAIIQNFMDNEARRLRQQEPNALLGSKERPEEGMDPPRPK